MIVVQKYGGSSVADIDKIKMVARRVITEKRKGHQVVVVVSAMGKTTDELISLVHSITKTPVERELDMILSTGEQISAALLTIALNAFGHPSISLTGSQVGIRTDEVFTRAKIKSIRRDRILQELSRGKIVVVTGFQGITDNLEITTLGRGGSDLTAVALSAILPAQICEIYTDVEGVYTADPQLVKNARKIDEISYDEMLEFASAGAGVLQPRSVEFAKKHKVVIHVRSSFSKKKGTIVKEETKDMEAMLVTGVSIDKNEAKVTIVDVPDKPGVAALIFGRLAEEDINVDMIVQSAGEYGLNNISFTVQEPLLHGCLKVMKKVVEEIGARKVEADSDVAKVSVIGVGMRSHSGVAAKMFSALASANINIELISTSEIKISCIIRKNQAEKALNVLHDAFNLGKRSKRLRKM